MIYIRIYFVLGYFALHLFSVGKADDDDNDCPSSLPLKIKGNCYRFETSPFSLKDAKGNCENHKAQLLNIKDPDILREIVGRASKFIYDKVKKAYFWVGFKMDDRSMGKKIEDRLWRFDFDESQVAQKDYSLWHKEPTDRGLTCAAIDGSNDFYTIAVDCGGARLPVLCMKTDEPCKDSIKPYFWYGKYCIASLNGALEYNKIHGACHPHYPTPVKDKEMQKYVILAAKNSFLGGGIFQDIIKTSGGFFYTHDGSQPTEDMWEEGEPRDDYDCVGLAWQLDDSLKLKTMHCDFMASSVCGIPVASGGNNFTNTGNFTSKRENF